MYESWKADSNSVHVSWRTYFRNMEDRSLPAEKAFQIPPGLISSRYTASTPLSNTDQNSQVKDHLKVLQLVRAYQTEGHHVANIDPLGLRQNGKPPHAARPADLDPLYHGFTEADMDREFSLSPHPDSKFVSHKRSQY